MSPPGREGSNWYGIVITVPIPAPLPNVAVHAVETPRIWFALADRAIGVITKPGIAAGLLLVVAERRRRKKKLPPVDQVLQRPEDFRKEVPNWPTESFGRSRKATVERGKFRWLYGTMLFRLGSTRQGIRSVCYGQEDFLELRMPQELLVISSDLARMDASCHEIREVMLELTVDAAGHRLLGWIPAEFERLVLAIVRAAGSDDGHAVRALDQLVVKLREIAGGDRVMPCLVE